jgi:hypothetical protein
MTRTSEAMKKTRLGEWLSKERYIQDFLPDWLVKPIDRVVEGLVSVVDKVFTSLVISLMKLAVLLIAVATIAFAVYMLIAFIKWCWIHS